MKVYLASPWFTPDQEEREDRIKRKLRELGFNVWSPKEFGVIEPDATIEERLKFFQADIDNIVDADMIFAITDGKDIGTIFEIGYANGVNINKDKKIIKVYYAETLPEGAPFNLMLAGSADYVFTKFEDLDKLPNMLKNNEKQNYIGMVI